MRTKRYLGQVIKKFRKQASMTQQYLADATGVTRTTIVAIEKNQRGVYDSELELFEKALFIDVGTLSNPDILPKDKSVNIHVNIGYRTGKPDKGEVCFYCQEKAPQMFYTYFGAPLCASCWDGWWRTETDDGKTDPPSETIKNKASGFWV